MARTILENSAGPVVRPCPSCRASMARRRMPCNRGCPADCAGVHLNWHCSACGRWWIFPRLPMLFPGVRGRGEKKAGRA